MKKTLTITAVQAVLYLIQFILFPSLFDKYYPSSNEAYWIFLISTLLFTVLGMLFVSGNFIKWLIADAVYIVLLIIYSGKGAYGIGMRGLFEAEEYVNSDRWLGIIILVICLLIIHMLSAGFFAVINKCRQRKKATD